MTRPRYDEHSTEFGLWLRQQDCIDSGLGFVTSNVDYIGSNYKTKEWMLIEEKRHNGAVTFAQRELFRILDKVGRADPYYRGFHFLRFENTSPDDGAIYLDNQEIGKDELLSFLRFTGTGYTDA